MVNKKGSTSNTIVGILVVVLLVAVISGFAFLFSSNFKSNIGTQSLKSTTEVNETGYVNSSGYTLAKYTALGFASPSISTIVNASGVTLNTGNYTLVGNVLYNATSTTFSSVSVTYTYQYYENPTAWKAVNSTEAAGYSIISYLPIVFLTLIVVAIIYIVVRYLIPVASSAGYGREI